MCVCVCGSGGGGGGGGRAVEWGRGVADMHSNHLPTTKFRGVLETWLSFCVPETPAPNWVQTKSSFCLHQSPSLVKRIFEVNNE